MKLLLFLIHYSRRTAFLAILAGVVSGASSTGLLAVTTASIRDAGPSRAGLMWIFVALCLALPLARFLSEALLIRLGQDALLDLRMRLSRQILAVPLRRLEEFGAHRMLASLTDDVPTVTNALLAIPIMCINTAAVAGGLIYLGWLSPWVLLVVLAFMALGVATYQLGVVKAVDHMRTAREYTDRLMGHFRALTEGTKELKLHSRRRRVFTEEVLRSDAVGFRQTTVKAQTIYTGAASWGQALGFAVVGLLVFAVPVWFAVSLQVMTGYVLVLLFVMTPLQVVMNTVPNLSRANVAVGRVEELGISLTKYAREEPTAERSDLPASWERLELRAVTLTYQSEERDESFTLGPVDLVLRPGELVFFIGGNGSGKTTLAKLLLGLYAPESGEIRLDGRPVTDENRDHYRQIFTAVFSDFYLFESLLGVESHRLDERAREYLERLQLAHKVRVADGALSTTKLSQGQRKRLALLTAYLEDRPVYLFDEWAADQDPLFKEVFYYRLLPELKARGKTVLVISHDDRFYEVGDRVVKLEYGKVVYDGAAAREPVAVPANYAVTEVES
ncbi:MAG TPA: cyclic peptide export ABC transporter [Pyrinomonadaceae bacterium]|nr:cyclic peptide export ABC transporter [Pyrinomonadaceae bacterium]